MSEKKKMKGKKKQKHTIFLPYKYQKYTRYLHNTLTESSEHKDSLLFTYYYYNIVRSRFSFFFFLIQMCSLYVYSLQIYVCCLHTFVFEKSSVFASYSLLLFFIGGFVTKVCISFIFVLFFGVKEMHDCIIKIRIA